MTIAALFSAQEDLLQQLHDLLTREQGLLMQAQVDGSALETIAKAKSGCLAHLDSLEKERQALQQSEGYGSNRAETERAALAVGEAERWERLQTLLSDNNRLNLLNGTLIMQRLRYNQRVLDDLRRVAGSPLYGADGQARSRNNRLETRA